MNVHSNSVEFYSLYMHSSVYEGFFFVWPDVPAAYNNRESFKQPCHATTKWTNVYKLQYVYSTVSQVPDRIYMSSNDS